MSAEGTEPTSVSGGQFYEVAVVVVTAMLMIFSFIILLVVVFFKEGEVDLAEAGAFLTAGLVNGGVFFYYVRHKAGIESETVSFQRKYEDLLNEKSDFESRVCELHWEDFKTIHSKDHPGDPPLKSDSPRNRPRETWSDVEAGWARAYELRYAQRIQPLGAASAGPGLTVRKLTLTEMTTPSGGTDNA